MRYDKRTTKNPRDVFSIRGCDRKASSDMDNSTCSTERCDSEAETRGLCNTHHLRKSFGMPAWPRDPQVLAEARFWRNVEKGPGCWEWLGGTVKGYGRMGALGKNAYAHRFSYELANGPIPDDFEVDHMCHNPGCVNPAHLRAVTRKQNTEHRAGANPNSKSGVHGVHWRKDAKKWQVTVHAGDKMHHGGYFVDLEDAKQAAIDLRNKLFTHNDRDRKAA